MAKKLISVALVLAIALAGWLVYYFSDKEVVRRQMGLLAVELSKDGQETPVQMALKLRKVKDMLAQSCRVTIADRHHVEELERDLVIHYLLYYRQRYGVINVVFAGMEIDIPAKGKATVQTMVNLERRKKAGDEPLTEQHKVEIGLHKGEENWLIHAVSMPDALTR